MFSRALEGIRHLFAHEPLRLIWLASVTLGLVYDQLDAGVSLENLILAVASFLITELGRQVVTSPATADPEHVH